MSQANSNPLRNVALLISTIPVAAWFSWKNRNYQLDDSLIYLRYVRNFFDGFGLTYNAGDHFNGLTSPLYSYILIAANAPVHNLQYTTIFLSFLFLCAAAIYGAILISDNRAEQALCGFFIVSFNYFYTTFGMETSLFLFLTALAFTLYRDERLFWTACVIGLAIITRTEAVFLGAVIFCHYVLSKKRIPPLKYLIAPAAIIAANLLFNYLYYGSPLPATGNAKIGQGRSGYWGAGLIFLHIDYMKGWFFDGTFRLAWFMIVTAAVGVWFKRVDLTTRLILIYLAFLGAFYVFLRIPNYHWYYAPFFYFLMLYCGSGVFQLTFKSIKLARKHRLYWISAVPCVLLIIAFSAANLKLSDISRGSFDPYKNIGDWIDNNTPKNSVVAAAEIGTIGWYSNRYIIDILGLTNPYNADYIAKKDVHAWLGKYSPDYILVHEPLWPFEASATCLTSSGAYAPEQGFHFPGYQLLAKSTTSGTSKHIADCSRGI